MMRVYLTVSLSVFSLSLIAADFEHIAPKAPSYFNDDKEKPYLLEEEKKSPEQGAALLQSLKTLDLYSPETYSDPCASVHTHPVELRGLCLSEKNQKRLVKELQEKFINQPLYEGTLTEIRIFISEFYVSINRPVVLVELPEQDITDGHLEVVVTESTLGKITYSGNKAFKTERYAKYMRQKPGQIIESDTLLADLAWINRNPFRYVTAALAPGSEPATTDIELNIKDQRPFRIYTGVDDTGIEDLDSQRFYAGFNWGNVFNSDHTLSYQYTASWDVNRFQAHSLFYSAPLPWRHLVAVFGGYSEVSADVGSGIKTNGKSGQASLRYDIPIKPDGMATQAIRWGVDFKRLNNTLDLGGIAISNYASLLQFMIGYGYSLKRPHVTYELDLEFFGSPGSFIPDMDHQRYNQLRRGANIRYLYSRASFANIWFLKKRWELHHLLKGQLSTGRLLTTEQYGLGGLYTVRGYRERVVNADNAFLTSVEIHTPPWRFFKNRTGKFTGIAFTDFGIGGSTSLTPSDPSETSYLWGIGPGFKLQIDNWLFFKGFFGYQLLQVGEGDGPPFRFSFSGYVTF